LDDVLRSLKLSPGKRSANENSVGTNALNGGQKLGKGCQEIIKIERRRAVAGNFGADFVRHAVLNAHEDGSRIVTG
jgi:hypothetical protein